MEPKKESDQYFSLSGFKLNIDRAWEVRLTWVSFFREEGM